MTDESPFAAGHLKEALLRASNQDLPELPDSTEFPSQAEIITQLDNLLSRQGEELPSMTYLKTLLSRTRQLIIDQGQVIYRERKVGDQLFNAAQIGQRIAFNALIADAQGSGMQINESRAKDNNAIAEAIKSYNHERYNVASVDKKV